MGQDQVSRCDLDLWPFEPKMYRYLSLTILHLCMKYESFTLKTIQVIVSEPKCWQSSVLTLTFEFLTPKKCWQTNGQTDRRTNLIPIPQNEKRSSCGFTWFILGNTIVIDCFLSFFFSKYEITLCFGFFFCISAKVDVPERDMYCSWLVASGFHIVFHRIFVFVVHVFSLSKDVYQSRDSTQDLCCLPSGITNVRLKKKIRNFYNHRTQANFILYIVQSFITRR